MDNKRIVKFSPSTSHCRFDISIISDLHIIPQNTTYPRVRSRFFHQNCRIVEYNKYLFKIDIFVGQDSRKPGYFIHRLISPEFSLVTKPRYDPERVGQRLVSWESSLRHLARVHSRAITRERGRNARPPTRGAYLRTARGWKFYARRPTSEREIIPTIYRLL